MKTSQLPFEVQCVLLTKRNNDNDEYNYLINSCLEIVSHFTRMAPGCIAEKGKHRSGACKTCNSGVSVIVDNTFANVQLKFHWLIKPVVLVRSCYMNIGIIAESVVP